MTKKKDVVINIRKPFHIESHRYEGGFRLTFTAAMDGSFRRKIVNIYFERWWISYIAREVRRVLVAEWEDLRRLTNLSEISPKDIEERDAERITIDRRGRQ